MFRRIESNKSVKEVSESGLKQLILAYKADKNGAVSPGWKLQPGFIGVATRSISARINQNYDAWPSDELKKSYHTFIGKPIFVNHCNEDPQRARGKVIAARYVEKGADKYIETIMEVDAQRFPKLAKEIREGGLDSVSMGVEAGLTICSHCGNKARDEDDFCEHVAHHKGEKLFNPRTGKKEPVHERCYKLSFFELSFVFDPADETAVVSRVIAANKRIAEEYSGSGDVQDESGPFAGPHGSFPVGTPKDRNDAKAVCNMPSVKSKHPGTCEKVERMSSYEHDLENLKKWPAERYVDDEPIPLSELELRELYRIGPGFAHTPHEASLLRWAYGEVEAPEEIDTLRDEDHEDYDDYQFVEPVGGGEEQREHADDLNDEDPFQHYLESPEELRAPDLSKTKRLDREQEQEGLDRDRRVEDVEDVLPEQRGRTPMARRIARDIPQDMDQWEERERRHRQHNRGVMDRYWETNPEHDLAPEVQYHEGRYLYAEDAPPQESDEELAEEAIHDIEEYEHGEEDSDEDFEDEDDSDEGDEEESDEDDDSDAPPWLHQDRTVGTSPSTNKRGRARKGTVMAASLAQRGKVASRDRRRHYANDDRDDDRDVSITNPETGDTLHYNNPHTRRLQDRLRGGEPISAKEGYRYRYADDSGHVDGGPYGVNDSQGEQEEVFISQVPGAEAVEAPGDDASQISNTPNNLVARLQNAIRYKAADLQRDLVAYRRIAGDEPHAGTGELPGIPNQGPGGFISNNPGGSGGYSAPTPETFSGHDRITGTSPITPQQMGRGARRYYAENVESPDEHDPALSGTDEQGLKGDFESLDLDDVETQPKDASRHAFAAFDEWLRSTTGRTAAQHNNANYIRRQATSWAKAAGIPLGAMFPTLEKVLRQARKTEGGSAMQRRADEKLEVAAPDARIDVEAPVKDVTDADAQASQYDLGDYGNNAGDNVADPDLTTDSQIWAPGEGGSKSANRMADAVAAVRYAEAHINAGLPYDDKWKLVAQAQTLRHATVVDRTRLMESFAQVLDHERTASRKVTAAVSRGTASGIPPGLARTAASTRTADNDPRVDYGLFI